MKPKAVLSALLLLLLAHHAAPARASSVQQPVPPSWGRGAVIKGPQDLAWLGVGLPDVGDGKAVSDHGRGGGAVGKHGYDDGSGALDALPAASVGQLLARAAFLALTFALPVLLAWVALLSAWFREKVWFGLLVRSIAHSGAAFIKVRV
jgi:hypothetical protein